MVVLPFLVFALIKLVFQYILNPQVWFAYYNHNTQAQHPPTSRAESIEGGISQENFRAVLDTIQAVSSNKLIESVPQINMIEAAPSISVPVTPPVPMKRKLHTQMSGVELFDDPDPIEEDSGTISNESGISNESCDRIKSSAST